MSLTNYLWFDTYMSAICETDETRIVLRIRRARSVLEQRLVSPLRPNPEEECAIRNALQGLAILMDQRNDRVNRKVNDLLRKFRLASYPRTSTFGTVERAKGRSGTPRIVGDLKIR